MTLLADYVTQVNRLLHDPNNAFYPLGDIQAFINEARTKVVQDTGCLRSNQSVVFPYGQEQYVYGACTGVDVLAGGTGYTNPTVVFSGGGAGSGVAATATVVGGAVTSVALTNAGSGYTSALSATISDPTGHGASIAVGTLSANTLDILNVSCFWGNQRLLLDWLPYSDFNTKIRFWNNFYQRPGVWTLQGQSTLFIGPLPDQTYQGEIDSVVTPVALTDYVTPDPIGVQYQGPIKYYAAYLAKFEEQSFGESKIFKDLYSARVLEVINTTYTRRIPNMYEEIGNSGGW